MDATPIKDGGPAFPGFSYTNGYGSSKRNASGEWENYVPGMSLRAWLAGMALQGMCANPDITAAMSEQGMKPWQIRQSFASSAVAQADELISELQKGG